MRPNRRIIYQLEMIHQHQALLHFSLVLNHYMLLTPTVHVISVHYDWHGGTAGLTYSTMLPFHGQELRDPWGPLYLHSKSSDGIHIHRMYGPAQQYGVRGNNGHIVRGPRWRTLHNMSKSRLLTTYGSKHRPTATAMV